MNRTLPLLAMLWLVSCGPADDAGSAQGGSTGAEGGAGAPVGPAAAPPGPRADAEAPTTPAPAATVRAVFLGTSLTAGFGLARDSERYTDLLQGMADSARVPVEIVNAGLSGDTSAGGLRRIDWVLQEPADVLVVELGANDGLRGHPVEAMEENLRELIGRARELSPGVRVVLVPMEAPPNMGERYTSAFRDVFPRVARELDVELAPFLLEGVGGVPELNQSDRIHPNAEGNRIMARTLWPHLEPVFRDAARERGVVDGARGGR